MFTPGDYVVYSIEGVCRVEEAGRLNVPGLERGRDYYRLTPYYRGGVIYTPVGGKATIRPVMTKTALQALLPELPGLPELTDVPTDIKQQSGFYREILAAHDCRKLLQLCKTIYNKQKQLAARRRTVSATELRSWKTAEEMLHQEFAFHQEMIESFASAVDSATLEEKRRLLRTIVKKVVWDGKNAYVYLFAEDGEADLPPIDQPMYPLGEDSE